MSRLTDEQATKFGHAVHAVMDGTEWDSDTFDFIASLASEVGVEFHDLDTPIDVWLRLLEDEEESVAEYEANTYHDNGGYRVEWYHNDVGQVSSKEFDTYAKATTWLESEGFENYTDNTDGNYATP